ncbi:uncharacterized protein LOC142337460 isoform X1 [Convolutriloba macropyga]|uniref:uncharacterized protein LOC142337460 isoform X1 n=1 Tax=Convolutriloba macropyga TaxID=536237 RepID=UPI003F524BCA
MNLPSHLRTKGNNLAGWTPEITRVIFVDPTEVIVQWSTLPGLDISEFILVVLLHQQGSSQDTVEEPLIVCPGQKSQTKLKDLVPDSHYSARIAAKTVLYGTTKFSQAYHFMTTDE